MPVHLEDGLRVGPNPYVQQKGVLRVEFLAETIEKPVMRVQFACFLVLDAEE